MTPAFFTAAFSCSGVQPNFFDPYSTFVIFVRVYPLCILGCSFGFIVCHQA
jgi:hypothetical protein